MAFPTRLRSSHTLQTNAARETDTQSCQMNRSVAHFIADRSHCCCTFITSWQSFRVSGCPHCCGLVSALRKKRLGFKTGCVSLQARDWTPCDHLPFPSTILYSPDSWRTTVTKLIKPRPWERLDEVEHPPLELQKSLRLVQSYSLSSAAGQKELSKILPPYIMSSMRYVTGTLFGTPYSIDMAWFAAYPMHEASRNVQKWALNLDPGRRPSAGHSAKKKTFEYRDPVSFLVSF